MSFGEYVNKNAEDLRKKFVDHEGKKEIIAVDITQLASLEDKEFKWDYFIKVFAEKIKENTKNEIGQVLESDFSTTGFIEKLASQVVLMHTVEKYFKYKMRVCGCGFSNVLIFKKY